jgi:hypothetical protein
LSPSNRRATLARSRSVVFSGAETLRRRIISAICSASISLAAREIVRKLPGTHASISRFTIALASASSPTKCMTAAKLPFPPSR